MTGTFDTRPRQPLSANSKAIVATPIGGAISYLIIWGLRDGVQLDVPLEAQAAITTLVTAILVWIVPNIPQPQRN